MKSIITDTKKLVSTLNLAQKVERSLDLIQEAYEEYGDQLVMAHSLGKDSSVVWHLVKLNPVLSWEEREIWQYLQAPQKRVAGGAR
jgi:3'-phosphoadenosine 5'-phosphosulfate sulfotransferase (PAPS reductase)/FAD synthetase